ncbi:ALBINO3-like protein 1, chloroplastic [Dioscorea cayenensis subsp. rotundata]|uniref:ALBINO3-like protein 1, chloroplastic n=1 Tax=Dioscorea cayennensis subsp. rotundata TaxID=55577 RepID=A0AB40B6K8_DIOCR|nr:ALBINO3-like protein 1, chloroplastic [Dioscorea cayenensis subsp. rotundata]
MASLLHSFQTLRSPLSLYPSSGGAMAVAPLSHRPHLGFFTKSDSSSPFLRRDCVVARFSPGPMLPDLESVDELVREVLGRAEGVIYTIADAAVSSSDAVAAGQGSKQSADWLSGITNTLESVLKVLKDALSALHVPYSYGFAIILLTVIVKAATFPLTKKQVESALAMRSLQPQVKAIQQRYAGDQERIQLETARVYKLAGVNPLAGCLPTLLTIPVWIGLYRALSNVADEGLLTEGFFWIPSLSGPTTIAARQSGSGISWLFPFIDGHPPLGWSDTLAYLVLPVLLIASQYISAQVMQPSQVNDPSQKSAQAVTKLLPLMIGYFALSVPSGLSLYWLTNNILSTAQQIWLQKLGGAKNPVKQFSDRAAKEESFNMQSSLSEIQKSVQDLEIDKSKDSQREKVNSGGLQPGERFKQIKEQEARRRKQREEQRLKEAEEVSFVINDQQNLDNKLVEKKIEQINGNPKPTLEENNLEKDIPVESDGESNNHAGPRVTDESSPHGDA